MKRLSDIIKANRSIKTDFSSYYLTTDDAEKSCIEFAKNFGYWLNNNWLIPTCDGYWKLDTSNIEYKKIISSRDEIFDTDELINIYLTGEGED